MKEILEPEMLTMQPISNSTNISVISTELVEHLYISDTVIIEGSIKATKLEIEEIQHLRKRYEIAFYRQNGKLMEEIQQLALEAEVENIFKPKTPEERAKDIEKDFEQNSDANAALKQKMRDLIKGLTTKPQTIAEKAKDLYRKITLLSHPDRHPNRIEYFKLAKEAYQAQDVETLSNLLEYLQSGKKFSFSYLKILRNRYQRLLFERNFLLKDPLNKALHQHGLDVILETSKRELENYALLLREQAAMNALTKRFR